MPAMPKRSFDELVALMKTLRGPDGCPWDRKQTLESLKPFIVEESYEVIDAIDRNDRRALEEELGDFLLQAVFLARDHKSLREARSSASARVWNRAGERRGRGACQLGKT